MHSAGGRHMGRRVVGLLTSATLALFAACGGSGGGGGGGSGIQGGGSSPPTPLPNQVCDDTNRICISVDKLILSVGSETVFTALAKNASGKPQLDVEVVVTSGSVVGIEDSSSGTTDQNGLFQGTLKALSGGSTLLTATAPGLGAISASVRVAVQGAAGVTPTRTLLAGQSTVTPTPMSASSVTTIFMETDPFTISSQNGGTVTVSAFAFDQDNRPLNNLNL